MNTLRKTLALALSCALLLSCMYIPAFAADEEASFTLTMNRLSGSPDAGFTIGDEVGADDELSLDEYVLLTLGTDASSISEYQVTLNFDSDVVSFQSGLNKKSGFNGGASVNDTLIEDWSTKTYNLQSNGESIITGGSHSENSTFEDYETTALYEFVFRVKTSAANVKKAKLFWLSQDSETKAKIGYRDSANAVVQYTPNIRAEAYCGIDGVEFTLTMNKLTGSPDSGFTVGGEIGAESKLRTGEYVLLTLGTDAMCVSEYQVTINFNGEFLAYQSGLGPKSGFNKGASFNDTLTEEWSTKTYNLQSDGKSIITGGAHSENATFEDYGTTALIRFAFQVRPDATDATGAMLAWLTEDTDTRAKLGYRDETGNTAQYTPDIGAELIREVATYTPGDVNGDDEIDVSDASAILDHVVKRVILKDNDFLAADVTKDGTVDVSDASRILDYVVKRITSFE